MAESKDLQDELTSDYMIRVYNRTAMLGKSTMELLKHLITLETDPDPNVNYEAAKAKVKQLSQEITASKPAAKFDYTLGDTDDLINYIDSIDETTHPFMSAAAKTIVTDILNQA